MPLNWMDVSTLSFNTLLLLERVQLSWLPGWALEGDLALALRGNPAVEWYMRHKCPELNDWLDGVMQRAPDGAVEPLELRRAEIAVLRKMEDFVVYVAAPEVYDAQPFLAWDTREMTDLVDFTGKTVVDIGAGTGRLTLIAAHLAETVFAVEPVGNLRLYLKQKARALGLRNVYPLDGLITDIPLPASIAGVTMGGHCFGEDPAVEYAEMERVTRPGGMIILCPGNNNVNNDVHCFLVTQGFQCAPFEEPRDGWKRKYWKQKT